MTSVKPSTMPWALLGVCTAHLAAHSAVYYWNVGIADPNSPYAADSVAFGSFDLVLVSTILLFCAVPLHYASVKLAIRNVARLVIYYLMCAYAAMKALSHILLERPDDTTIYPTDWCFWSSLILFVVMNQVTKVVGKKFDAKRADGELGENLLGKSDEDAVDGVTIKKLVGLITAEWTLVIQAFFFLVIASIAQVLIPSYMSAVISLIIKSEEGFAGRADFYEPLKAMIVVSLICAAASSCRGATFQMIGARVNRRLRQRLFESLLSQEVGFFDCTRTGELTSRMTQDVQKVTDQVTLNVNVFIRTTIQAIVTLIFMFHLSPRLTLLAFVSVPVVVVISDKYAGFMHVITKDIQTGLAKANAITDESMSSMATVRSFAAEKLESVRFEAKLGEVYNMQKKMAVAYIFFLATIVTLPNMVSALVLFYGGRLAEYKMMNSGDLLAFVFYLQTLTDSFNSIGDMYSAIVQALGAAEKVFEFLERKPLMERSPQNPVEVDAANVKGEITIKGVEFYYPARPTKQVLKDFDLTIPAGKVVALVGPSGGGKSTAIGMIERWYAAKEGQVYLDGISVDRYNHEKLHEIISIVGQEPTLYARTIKENILYGLQNPGMEVSEELEARIMDACKLANAHTFISALPDGYDTEVGERGVQLSGGQKQRIAIARALVRKPKVLLLDEATSALDAESERQVQAAIDKMIATTSMTVVVIAHRLSTVRNADQICVVSGGKIAEQGTHDELCEAAGIYWTLVKSQLGLAGKDQPAPIDNVSTESGTSSEGPKTP